MKRALITMTVCLALAGACKQKETASVGAEPQPVVATSEEKQVALTPEQMGELGAKIEKSPDRAATLLSEHGLNEKTFEQEIRKITEDPAASKRYAAAYEKAKA
jgi:nucleotide-binding universal stress UspA family protein